MPLISLLVSIVYLKLPIILFIVYIFIFGNYAPIINILFELFFNIFCILLHVLITENAIKFSVSDYRIAGPI